ncbi:hypothetical protein K502DRAFT_330367 [Neoconidiobolus thromboides FSU 785]|nr:hypothetical protein K502DRAFT_330367 [Neoconidiobolus thromboides FSU 785]
MGKVVKSNKDETLSHKVKQAKQYSIEGQEEETVEEGEGENEEENEEGEGESEEENEEENKEEEEGDYIDEDLEEEEEDYTDEDLEEEQSSKGLKPMDAASLQKFNEKIEKSGVVYISRIPPRFKPNKLKSLLAPYKLKIGRVYFAAEDERARLKRKKMGGSTIKHYTEGWIEFMDKKKAKSLVKLLNNTNMDKRKHGYHHEDIWNLKYLPKFKWHHLTERIAYEKEVRAQRLRNEISMAKKLNQQYIDKVELKKQIEGMESKKGNSNKNKMVRSFHQRKVQNSNVENNHHIKNDNKKKKKTEEDKEKDLNQVLDSIF